MTTQSDFDPQVLAPQSWHGWTLDPDSYSLVWRGGHSLPPEYTIDLTQMRTAERVVFWTFQIAGKGAADLAVAGFVRALDELLWPQDRFANGKTIDADTILALVSEYLKPSQR